MRHKTDPFEMRARPSIVGTGLLALDIVMHVNEKQSIQLYAGGTCGNVLAIQAFLGWKAFPVARLNGDEASRVVELDLKRWGVRLDFAKQAPPGKTPIIIHRIGHTKGGDVFHRFSFTCPNCGAWLPGYRAVHSSAAQTVAMEIDSPGVFFFDRPSRGAIELAEASARVGAVVVFEPSGSGDKRLFREALQHAHVLKYSNERMNELTGLTAANGPLLVIETLGCDGLRYKMKRGSRKASKWQVVPAYHVLDVRDAAGAGDWCTAGIIHLLGRKGRAGLESCDDEMIRNAIQFGQALAAWNCRHEGARGGMYVTNTRVFRQEVRAILAGKKLGNVGSMSDLRRGARPLGPIAPCCNTRIDCRVAVRTPARKKKRALKAATSR